MLAQTTGGWREDAAKKSKDSVICPCKGTYKKGDSKDMERHFRTKKHISKFPDGLPPPESMDIDDDGEEEGGDMEDMEDMEDDVNEYEVEVEI